MSKQIKKTDLIGDYWEDDDGKKIRIKESNFGETYEEDEDGNKTYYRENFSSGQYRETDGEKEYLRKDSWGNSYYENESGEKTFYKKDRWGNQIREVNKVEKDIDQESDTNSDFNYTYNDNSFEKPSSITSKTKSIEPQQRISKDFPLFKVIFLLVIIISYVIGAYIASFYDPLSMRSLALFLFDYFGWIPALIALIMFIKEIKNYFF